MIYLKLVLGNVGRSLGDYLLYVLSTALLAAVVCVSFCTANFGNMQAGFQTFSLPLLVVLAAAVLADFMNAFLIRRRATELGLYLLLGMEKRSLSALLLLEFAWIGLCCLLLGIGAGLCAYRLLGDFLPGGGACFAAFAAAKSGLQTLFCFIAMQAISLLRIRQRLYRMQIFRLMQEKQYNRPLRTDTKSFWGWMAALFLLIYGVLLLVIAFLKGTAVSAAVSLIAVPMLGCVFSFYRWAYAFLSFQRREKAEGLYRGIRLYRVAEITVNAKTDAGISAVFCGCLLFSAAAFVFGVLLQGEQFPVFSGIQQRWMCFLQFGICIIFLVIYFSILSLLQLVAFKRQAQSIRILYALGKSDEELRALLKTQLLRSLLAPAAMAFFLLWMAAPFVRIKLDRLLPSGMRPPLLPALCGFMGCFAAPGFCYLLVVYRMGKRVLPFRL